jgi:hypothetical protein
MTSGLPAVDVQNLTGDKGRSLEIQDSVDDVADLSDVAERVKLAELLVGGDIVRGRVDDAERDRVDAHAA